LEKQTGGTLRNRQSPPVLELGNHLANEKELAEPSGA
jgi:hypothetical protein